MGYYDSKNRGPKTDLLSNKTSTPVRAPNWQLYRHSAADDAAAVKGRLALAKESGLNCAGFRRVGIKAVPRDGETLSDDAGGTATLTVTPYEWSDGDNAFVACDGASAAGPGAAGVTVGSEIEANGKILFLHVTGLGAGESFSVYSQGFITEPEY